MKYYYILNNCFLPEYILKCHLFLWWQSWIFSSHYYSLQCHMILQKAFLYPDLVLKKQVWTSTLKMALQHNSSWKPRYIFFRILWWIESSKQQHLFEIEILCTIISLLSLLIHLKYNCWIKYSFLLRFQQINKSEWYALYKCHIYIMLHICLTVSLCSSILQLMFIQQHFILYVIYGVTRPWLCFIICHALLSLMRWWSAASKCDSLVQEE